MRRARALAPLLLVALFACGEPEAAPAGARAEGPRTAWVEIRGQRFELELAADPATRFRGLGGRSRIERNGGMLFVFPREEPLAMVMRDCPIAIDVAFLDAAGGVLAVHSMRPEPPRRADETALAYESRLPTYASGAPARFAIETAGGRLTELGLRAGDRVLLDARTLIGRGVGAGRPAPGPPRSR